MNEPSELEYQTYSLGILLAHVGGSNISHISDSDSGKNNDDTELTPFAFYGV